MAKSSPGGRRRNVRNISIRRTITIRRRPADVYAFCRDLHNLEPLMPAGAKVEMKNERTSHWSVRAPGGKRIEWDAEIVDDEPNRLVAWQSADAADVTNSGSLRFEPTSDRDEATKLKIEVHYTPPGGLLGSVVGHATRDRAGEEVAAGLRRLKEQIESKE